MKQALAIAVLTALVVPSALAFTLDSPAPAPLTGPANGDSGSYAGVLRLYVVEPVSRWNDYEGDPYH
ncbi:MAG: hypothetical protein ACP5EK_05165, partial [Thermoplasmatota archaeon]